MTAVTADVVAARVPQRTWRAELRAAKAVWRRDMIRFVNDRAQVMTWLIQPLLFLFVLGAGLQSLAAPSTGGVDLKTFIFPGVVCIAVLFTAMISAASLVWDRELGFLQEMIVAPVSRTSILVGKCLGGATIAASQGVIVLALAGLVGVPYDPVLILGAVALLVLLSLAVSAFGVLVAVTIKQAQTFTWIMQLVVFPMVFLSGALYPVGGLPAWLEVLNRLNPLTYAVDPMRRLVFSHLDVSEEARRTLDPGVNWWDWHLSPWFEVAMVLLLGVAMLSIAIRKFSRTE
jgi:ABC-2 type transport system permease protein